MVHGLVKRRDERDGRRSVAVFSTCGLYRYALSRRWGDGGVYGYVMLNPSTADEARNDPTIERCERRARQDGAGGIIILNLFAFRATKPADLFRQTDPVGPMNDAVLGQELAHADRVICGWGAHGSYNGRGAEVAAMLRARSIPLWHLGLTKDGHPRHPLYIAYRQKPEQWAINQE